MQATQEKAITEELALLSPKRNFDDSVGDRILQVKHESSWIEVTEEVFRSWTGLRRINGDDHHGPIYGFGTLDDSIPYTGSRACGCNRCQHHVEPRFKMN